MLFTGHSLHVIDAKSRLAIPAKYRAQWDAKRDGGAWFCVPWPKVGAAKPEGIVRLYTEAAFDAMSTAMEREAGGLMATEDQASLDRGIFGIAERLEMDPQGRITLPPLHLKLTGLSGEVAVVGSRNRLEVHDRAEWLAAEMERFVNLPSLVEGLAARSRKED